MFYPELDSVETVFSKCYANRGSKGSGATHARAQTTFAKLGQFCKQSNFGRVCPKTVTAKQVRLFFQFRLHKICDRTAQTELSHIRMALIGAGRLLGDIHNPQNPFSTERCGIAKVSRKSDKLPCSIEVFNRALEQADPGLQHVLRLQKVLGLRGQEAVMAGNLRQWVKKLEQHEVDRSLHLLLTVGTKGGRPRDVFVHPKRIEQVRQVVVDAHAFQKSNGNLILADSLKSVMGKYQNQMTALGMVSDDSGHGLRRLFAWEQYQDYLESGLTEIEALGRVAQDLGHGEGRGRMVKDSYLNAILIKEDVENG